MTRDKRSLYLDILRIFACFLVIFNHQRGVNAYRESTNIVQAFCSLGLTMLTQVNVPIFLMISGTLLIPKETGYKKLFTKRIVRIVLALVCASLVMYILSIRDDIFAFDFGVYFRKLLSASHCGVYWYLYAYLGFLISLPFMQRIAKRFTHADFRLILLAYFFTCTFVPLCNYALEQFGISAFKISNLFSFPLTTLKALFFPLAGYYIDQVFDITKLNRKNIWILLGVLVLSIAIPSAFTYHQGIHHGYTLDFVQTFDYVTAIAVFLLVKYLYVNTNAIQNSKMLHRFVSVIAPLTFGIYLMDPALWYTARFYNVVVTIADPILYSFIWCIYSMAVCGTMTFLLKKIPFVNKLL